MAEQEPRRSQRLKEKRGLRARSAAPSPAHEEVSLIDFGDDGEQIQNVSEPAGLRDSSSLGGHSVTSRRSRTSRAPSSTASSQRRRLRAQAELEAAEAAALLEQELLSKSADLEKLEFELKKSQLKVEKSKLQKSTDIQKTLIEKRKEVQLAKIDEEEEGSGRIYTYDSNDSQSLSEDESSVTLLRAERVQQWQRKAENEIKPPSVRPEPKHDFLRPLATPFTTRQVSTPFPKRNEHDDTHAASQSAKSRTPPAAAGWEQALLKTIEVIQMQATATEGQIERRELSSTSLAIEKKQEFARRTVGRKPPTFSGKPEEWPSFKNMFDEATKLCGFSEIENILRLQECLKGDAREAVQALFNAPSNVPVILKTLERRFGKPEFIVEALISKAKKFTAMKEDQYDRLVEFATAVNNLATTAMALDSDHHLLNPSLRKELVDRLPVTWKTQWGVYLLASETTKPSIVTLSDWLNTQAEALSNVYTPKAMSDEKAKETTARPRDRVKKKDSVLVVSSGEAPAKATKACKCSICDVEGHGLWECKTFQKKEQNEKWDFVKSKKLCFSCLVYGHQTEKCRRKKKCGRNGCTQPHHPLLHYEKKSSPHSQKSDTAGKEKKSETDCDGSKSVLQLSGGEKIVHKVIPVVLKGPNKSLKSFALLDEGSRFTIIDHDVAEELELEGPEKSFQYTVAGNVDVQDDKSRVVSLQISDFRGKSTYALDGVRTKRDLGMPRQTLVKGDLPQKLAELNGVDFQEFVNAKPMILIGLDNFKLIANQKVKYGPRGTGGLGKTPLGWAFYGTVVVPTRKNEDGAVLCQFEPTRDQDLHQLVKDSFSTEAFGVKVLKEKLRSKEDERALRIMEATTRRVGGSWETGLIWSRDEIRMPESYANALRRLQSMERRMDRDPVFAAEYERKIQEYVDSGYAKYLTKEEAIVVTPRTWYLPHFGVINPNKPGKMRFVFDAAAKSYGASLNDFLLPGPDLLISLPGSLIKFRQRRIGFSGDVKEFFHRVKVRPEDRSAQRFLWRGMDRDRDPDILVMTVSTFGATCSPFTSQAAKNKNAEEFRDEFPEAASAIVNRHYMDDYLDSVDTPAEAVKLITEVIEVHRRGDFHMGKFVSSCKEVLLKIPPAARGESANVKLDGRNEFERVLGLEWNSDNDTLGFNIKFHKVKPEIVTGGRRPTKREVLRVVMSVFDPLGLLAHFSVQGKILLQAIWRSGIGWDDELPGELETKWARWVKQLDGIREFKILRCYAPALGEKARRQLHLFCDASAQAFSAAAYLRSERDGDVYVSLVMAKTRVAPLKTTMTIPRLELQGAVMASRLSAFIESELELSVDEVHFWTDSMTVVRWLRSDSRNYKIFVAHRIGEILELTKASQWHWVPTKQNPADDATRDDKPANLDSVSRWTMGPDFLLLGKDEWPKPTQLDTNTPYDEELEMKKSIVGAVLDQLNSPLPDPRRFSSWLKLIRATAWMFRFLTACRKKPQPGAELRTEELQSAEKLWILHVQQSAFGDELKNLVDLKPLDKKSPLRNLSPILDEHGVIRMDGRTKAARELDDDAKSPIILPSQHRYVELLIAHHHRKAGHHGRERVLNDLRRRFWILDARRAVKRSWTHCQRCKNARATPVIPEMGQLPSARLNPSVKPFTFCGVDYFGPMEVTVGRRHEKRWGVLFTCLTMRAVHLEIADSLSTDSCIMALRRMMNRRGPVKEMWSDNGTNFHGANNELKLALSELDQQKIKREMISREVNWSFIPPGSPHMGGCWERLVQSVKIALRAILKERAPREEILRTLMTEAENSVNSRPLTTVSLDPAEPRPLTPNDLLVGHATPMPPGKFDDHDLFTRKMWRYSQKLADDFWRRWIREYLPTLTRRTKWTRRAEPIKVGDVVVVVDETLERNHWPLGKITEVFPGVDGQVRVVEVQTAHGIYRRPAAKIAVLDVKEDCDGVGPADATPGRRMSRAARVTSEPNHRS